MLNPITNNPTISNKIFGLTFFTNKAANGAATTPPIISPKIGAKLSSLMKNKKVLALARETNISTKLPVPTANRGCCPFPINVELTTGPQPPPPIASAKPPIPAKYGRLFPFESNGFDLFLKIFFKINSPIMNR